MRKERSPVMVSGNHPGTWKGWPNEILHLHLPHLSQLHHQLLSCPPRKYTSDPPPLRASSATALVRCHPPLSSPLKPCPHGSPCALPWFLTISSDLESFSGRALPSVWTQTLRLDLACPPQSLCSAAHSAYQPVSFSCLFLCDSFRWDWHLHS